MSKYYVYILTSKYNNVFYVGITGNMGLRIEQHKNRIADGFTKKYNVNRLVYYEKYSTALVAIKQEKQLKRWKRAWKIELIRAVNPGWKDLSSHQEVPDICRSDKFRDDGVVSKNLKAFSLIEVLTVMIIAMILCVLAIPNYSALVNRIHQDQATDTLYHAIHYAKASAIRENQIVTLCPLNRHQECVDNWENGFWVFVASSGKRLKHFQLSDFNGRIKWRNFRNKPYLQLTPLGYTNHQNGSFYFYSKNGALMKKMVVSRSGRVRIL